MSLQRAPTWQVTTDKLFLSIWLPYLVWMSFIIAPLISSTPSVEAIKMESEAKSTEIMQTLALMCGVWQVVLCVLQLGKLTWILSSVVVSAYTCSAAFHVATSQVKGIFGVPIPERDVIVGKIFYVSSLACFKLKMPALWLSTSSRAYGAKKSVFA